MSNEKQSSFSYTILFSIMSSIADSKSSFQLLVNIQSKSPCSISGLLVGL